MDTPSSSTLTTTVFSQCRLEPAPAGRLRRAGSSITSAASLDFQLVVESYVNDYLDNRDSEARHSLSKWLRNGVVTNIATTEELAHREFYHSDFYHEILKPLNYHHSLYLGIKAGLAPIGILALHRKLGEKAFSQREKERLQELSSVITYALEQSECCTKTLLRGSEAGLIILNDLGHPYHVSPKGRKLLFLATHSDVKKGMILCAPDQLKIPSELITLISSLLGMFHEKIPVYRSLSWVKNNSWGCFVFKALVSGPSQRYFSKSGLNCLS